MPGLGGWGAWRENAPLAQHLGGGSWRRGWLCLASSTLNTFAQSSGHHGKVRRLHRSLPVWASAPPQHGRAALQDERRTFPGKKWGLCACCSQGVPLCPSMLANLVSRSLRCPRWEETTRLSQQFLVFGCHSCSLWQLACLSGVNCAHTCVVRAKMQTFQQGKGRRGNRSGSGDLCKRILAYMANRRSSRKDQQIIRGLLNLCDKNKLSSLV